MELTEQAKVERMKNLNAMKAQAVQQAAFEVMGEQRAEIVKRARAKLVAMGFTIAECETSEGSAGEDVP